MVKGASKPFFYILGRFEKLVSHQKSEGLYLFQALKRKYNIFNTTCTVVSSYLSNICYVILRYDIKYVLNHLKREKNQVPCNFHSTICRSIPLYNDHRVQGHMTAIPLHNVTWDRSDCELSTGQLCKNISLSSLAQLRYPYRSRIKRTTSKRIRNKTSTLWLGSCHLLPILPMLCYTALLHSFEHYRWLLNVII